MERVAAGDCTVVDRVKTGAVRRSGLPLRKNCLECGNVGGSIGVVARRAANQDVAATGRSAGDPAGAAVADQDAAAAAPRDDVVSTAADQDIALAVASQRTTTTAAVNVLYIADRAGRAPSISVADPLCRLTVTAVVNAE